jgi:hypothetical protein
MKLLSKVIVTGLSVLLVQFAFAANEETAQFCAPSECPKPCAPAPCPKPCPPKPCPKPCAPAPCPKPCPPAPCPKPCPPKPCKPCPPVCFERGYPNDNCCFPSAYNEPANFELGPCPWDFWFDASFTYWDAYEEGLDLAENSTHIAGVTEAPIDGGFLFQNNQYKPGFKVGLGMDIGHDDWSGYAEYTWFRSRTSTSSAAPEDPRGGTPVWILSNWFNYRANITELSAAAISSKWRLNMDLVDVGVTRPYYQGTHLIVAPFGGMRGQWVRQKLNVSTTPVAGTTGIDAVSRNKSNSWAVGPSAGCLAKWHLGWGVRFEGDVSAALLYTRYTKVSNSQTPSFTGESEVASSFHNYNTLRAYNEMNLGLGWGSYFDCRNYHLDLLLTYDFQVFWNQNIMRQLVDTMGSGTGHSPSNLYLQGLTVKAQFDF